MKNRDPRKIKFNIGTVGLVASNNARGEALSIKAFSLTK